MFEKESGRLLETLSADGIVIEHIGSTAVPGLEAKPIIDIMIGLPDFGRADAFVPLIQGLGYEYIQKYEDEMPFRRFLYLDEDGGRRVNIHMVGINSPFWKRHLMFRDYLRQNPTVREEYHRLKLDLAAREWTDRNDYAQAKTDFIRKAEKAAEDYFIKNTGTTSR
jgi:GrpB-like predicted nucleotidyltransferase (UPF0157 family)